jgi:phage gp36-like protein
MGYCSQNDILKMISQEEMAELTAEAGDLPDTQVVEEAIAEADSEIEAYIGSRYMVPLSPVPPRIKALSVDMAIYHLYSRRSVIPPVRREKYEAAVAFLKEVASGLAVLEGQSGVVSESSGDVAGFSSACRIFSRDSQKDW